MRQEKGMEDEWERGGRVTGRQQDRRCVLCPAVTPLVSVSSVYV